MLSADYSGKSTFADDKQKVLFLERKFQIGSDMDAVLEQCLHEHLNLSEALDAVFACIKRHLKPSIIFIKTFDENLVSTLFSFGIVNELLVKSVPELLDVASPTKKGFPALDWFAMPLDMSGETVGTFGLAYAVSTLPFPDDQLFELMDVISEELDSYFFTIQENCRKRNFITDIHHSLEGRILSKAVEDSLRVLVGTVPVEDLLFLYLEESFLSKPRFQYFLFRENQKLFDSISNPMPRLEAIIDQFPSGLPNKPETFAGIIEVKPDTAVIELSENEPRAHFGTMLFNPVAPEGFSINERELLNVFAELTRQRFIDFNKENYILRRHFSPDDVRRILNVKDYRKAVLGPKWRDSGILFVGFRGFISACEKAYNSPEKTFLLLEQWLLGVGDILFRNGGALGSVRGDFLNGLFGPPFHEWDPGRVVSRLMNAALQIKSFSREYLLDPSKAELQNSRFFKEIGVSLSLAFGPSLMGSTQSNLDFFALGPEADRAENLLGDAQPGEIVVTPTVKDLAEMLHPGIWVFDGPFTPTRSGDSITRVFFKCRL